MPLSCLYSSGSQKLPTPHCVILVSSYRAEGLAVGPPQAPGPLCDCYLCNLYTYIPPVVAMY